MILMIDNYDSFVYNLYQYIGIFDSDIRVIRNDKLTLEDIHRMAPEGRSDSQSHRGWGLLS